MNRKNIFFGAGVIILLTLIAAGLWAAWYTFDRFVKIEHNAQCDRFTAKPAPNTEGVNALPLCVYEIVPPTLWEKFTGLRPGAHPVYPISEGCDQSATTTDCASLPIQNTLTQSEVPGVGTESVIIGNFTLSYPKGQGNLSEFGWEGVVEPGNYKLVINGMTNYDHFIFTAPSPLSPIKPNAKSLDEFRIDYTIAATGTHQVLINGKPTDIEQQYGVHIISTEDVTINGIPMLRQRFSAGYWQVDPDGGQSFHQESEMGFDNELRYVFFDGKTFVVLTSWDAAASVDYVAHTIHLNSIRR